MKHFVFLLFQRHGIDPAPNGRGSYLLSHSMSPAVVLRTCKISIHYGFAAAGWPTVNIVNENEAGAVRFRIQARSPTPIISFFTPEVLTPAAELT